MGVDLCLIAGPVSSVVVQVLKRFPVVQRYPKVILALLTGGYAFTVGSGWECWLETLAAGIAGYEIVLKPLSKPK